MMAPQENGFRAIRRETKLSCRVLSLQMQLMIHVELNLRILANTGVISFV